MCDGVRALGVGVPAPLARVLGVPSFERTRVDEKTADLGAFWWCADEKSRKINKSIITLVSGRFRRRSIRGWDALTVLVKIHATLGHGLHFAMAPEMEESCIPLRGMPYILTTCARGGGGGGQHGGGRGGLHGGLRGKYANCAAGRCQGCVDDLQGVVSFLNHPWLASESSGEQSCAIFSDFDCGETTTLGSKTR